MRKIKIKEKNHNLRIKYKEGEWKSATSVATALCTAATQVIFESMIDDSDKKQFFDAMVIGFTAAKAGVDGIEELDKKFAEITGEFDKGVDKPLN
jgi:hypothetical protein